MGLETYGFRLVEEIPWKLSVKVAEIVLEQVIFDGHVGYIGHVIVLVVFIDVPLFITISQTTQINVNFTQLRLNGALKQQEFRFEHQDNI